MARTRALRNGGDPLGASSPYLALCCPSTVWRQVLRSGNQNLLLLSLSHPLPSGGAAACSDQATDAQTGCDRHARWFGNDGGRCRCDRGLESNAIATPIALRANRELQELARVQDDFLIDRHGWTARPRQRSGYDGSGILVDVDTRESAGETRKTS